MNKKGFTLIELLMVIVLIGIISLILVPNVITMVNKNNEKSCESFKNNVVSAAKMYVAENKYTEGFTCGAKIPISLQKLVNAGNLSEPVKNPVTKSDVNLSNVVNVTFDCSTKKFTYEFSFVCEN